MFILRLKALKIDTISRLRKKVKTTSISFVLAQHNILPLNLYFVFSICSSQTYYFGTQYVALCFCDVQKGRIIFWKMSNVLLHNLTFKYAVIVSQLLLKLLRPYNLFFKFIASFSEVYWIWSQIGVEKSFDQTSSWRLDWSIKARVSII